MSRLFSVKRAAFASVLCITAFPVLFAQTRLESSIASSKRLPGVSQTKIIRVGAREARSLSPPNRSPALSIKPVTIYYAARGPRPAKAVLPTVSRTLSGKIESVTIYYRVPKARAEASLSPVPSSRPAAATTSKPAETTVPTPPIITAAKNEVIAEETAPAAPAPAPAPVSASEAPTASQTNVREDTTATTTQEKAPQDPIEPAQTIAEPKAVPQAIEENVRAVDEVRHDAASTASAAPTAETPAASTIAPAESAVATETTTPSTVDSEAHTPQVSDEPTKMPGAAIPVEGSGPADHAGSVAGPEFPTDALELNNSAVLLTKQSRYEEASQLLRKAVETAPGAFKLRRNLSIVYESMKKFDEAMVEAEAAVALAPNEPSALTQLCGLQLLTAHESDAVACYERLLKLQEPDALTETFYGVALLRSGDANRALPLLQKAAVSAPTNSATQNAVGVAYFQLKRYSEAVAAFKTAVEADPDRIEIRFNLGIAQLAVGNREGALSQYRVLKMENPKLADELYKILFRDKVVTVDQLQSR